jgi:hypothetical protein
MSGIARKRLDFLFRVPTIEPVVPGWNSTVHLVRRECQETLANIRRTSAEDSFPGKRPPHRLFAGSIVICSAIDLLGKFCNGDDLSNTQNFRRILTRYGGLTTIEARRIYDARNALTHSFGVRVVRPRRRRKGLPPDPPFVSSVRIQLTPYLQVGPVVRVGKRRWQISVPGLYRLMLRIIKGLESDLRGTEIAARVDLFNRMFVRYGRIRMK